MEVMKEGGGLAGACLIQAKGQECCQNVGMDLSLHGVCFAVPVA